MLHQKATTPSRRATPRVSANQHQEIWVYWQCNGRDDLSRVRDLGLGGLFLETTLPRTAGIPAKLHFLVQEGPIRADAIIRHSNNGHGLGVKFTAVNDSDRPHFAALLKRLHT